ncbi:hypothetical protein [Extibacter muris]|uniref:hypothetical protein n=1 Tax=Extibacter muris TaxID=1796622 RepID=UPI001D088BCC|nr:hypothetical protein [Extibacter muris]MCB6202409.1 hypothetical protein [Extibacter muris]MCQ4665339.1 hypothetical protein [Extibacter muris]MCQ4694708.1 hypothetical protein [Extibacter muris]
MEKIKRALGYISMAVMILVLLYVKYAYERGLELWPVKTKLQHDEVKVERKIKIPEGETMEFIQPAFLVGLSQSSTETPEDVMEELEEGNYGHELYEEAKLNEDGTRSMTVTGKQLENWISTSEDAINMRIEDGWDKGLEIKIEKDYTKVTYIMKEGCELSFMGWGMYAQVIMGCLFEIQSFTGIAPEDCHVREVVKRESDGVVIIDAVSPGAYYEVTDAQWYGEEEIE